MNKYINTLLVITLVVAGIFVSGCLSGNADTSKSTGSENVHQSQAVQSETGSQDYPATGTGTEQSGSSAAVSDGQATKETVFDEDLDFGTVYTVSGSKGDAVYVKVTADGPVNCYAIDDAGYEMITEKSQNGDIKQHVIANFTEFNTQDYHQAISFGRDGAFHLIVLRPDGDTSTSAHIKAIRYSVSGKTSSTSSSNINAAKGTKGLQTGTDFNQGTTQTSTDSNQGTTQTSTDSSQGTTQTSTDSSQGTQGVDNTYTVIDTDFDYQYGATGLMYHADLMKGDTVEVEATTNLPVNFISGDDQLYQSYLMGSGNVNSFMNDGMDKGSVYQEESYSGATSYSLNKEMDRKSFNLIIQNPEGDSSLEGHIKIVVHSQYTKAEHGSGDGSY